MSLPRRYALCGAVLVLLAWSNPAFAQTTIDRSGFQGAMRQLWADQTLWTRLHLVTATGDLPEKDATTKRLLKTPDVIGAALKPFYGDSMAARVTVLLKDHLMIRTQLVESALQGDNTMRKPLTDRWMAKADSLALLLSRANPRFWPVEAVKPLLHEQLELIVEQLVARSAKDWVADVAAFDKTQERTLKLADRLSSGIIQQFPRRFTR